MTYVTFFKELSKGWIWKTSSKVIRVTLEIIPWIELLELVRAAQRLNLRLTLSILRIPGLEPDKKQSTWKSTEFTNQSIERMPQKSEILSNIVYMFRIYNWKDTDCGGRKMTCTQGRLDYDWFYSLKILAHFRSKVLEDFLHYVTQINCLTGAIISETYIWHILRMNIFNDYTILHRTFWSCKTY